MNLAEAAISLYSKTLTFSDPATGHTSADFVALIDLNWTKPNGTKGPDREFQYWNLYEQYNNHYGQKIASGIRIQAGDATADFYLTEFPQQ